MFDLLDGSVNNVRIPGLETNVQQIHLNATNKWPNLTKTSEESYWDNMGQNKNYSLFHTSSYELMEAYKQKVRKLSQTISSHRNDCTTPLFLLYSYYYI